MTKNIKLRSGSSWMNLTPIYSSGFPNGVVSAPVGSTYIDTAATNGAIEWKKATGTGNTGWVVSTNSLDRHVVIRANGVVVDGATSSTTATLPENFLSISANIAFRSSGSMPAGTAYRIELLDVDGAVLTTSRNVSFQNGATITASTASNVAYAENGITNNWSHFNVKLDIEKVNDYDFSYIRTDLSIGAQMRRTSSGLVNNLKYVRSVRVVYESATGIEASRITLECMR